jgi:hypothetical protein
MIQCMRYSVPMEDIRYPIGKHDARPSLVAAERAPLIRQIEELPAALRAAIKGLTAAQLDTPYREGGWTPRQIVHHLADSHMHLLIRIKYALTEDNPSILAFNQDAWSGTADVIGMDPEASLKILEGVHARTAALLRSMAPVDFARTFRHPERGPVSLDFNLQLYSWHGRHHAAQITELRKRQGW